MKKLRPAISSLRTAPGLPQIIKACFLELFMRTRLFAFLLCFLPLLAVAQTDTPSLTVSTNNTPLDRKVLERVANEAFKRIGVNFKMLSLPSERSLVAANSGEIDGEGLRIAGLGTQYPNLVQVPERFTRISFVAFARDASIPLEGGWESLKAHRVAFINGWKMFEANASGARVVNKVDKPEQMFRMLDEGRIDLALYTQADGVALAKSLGLAAIAPLQPSLKDVDMFLYVHRKHEALVPRLAKALKEMKMDGTYNRIMAGINAE
jgi:polar amino acid transport system substrate-binding protein